MKNIIIFSVGTPPAFTVPTTAENYWQERLACELSNTIFNLSDDSVTIDFAEESDLLANEQEIDQYISDVQAWADDVLVKKEEGGVMPAYPTAPVLSNNAAQLGLLNFLLKCSFGLELSLIKVGGGTNTKNLEAILKKALGYPNPSDPDDWFPVIEKLASQALAIYISKYGEFQDITYLSPEDEP
jgi:hypothetical protein